MHICILGNCYLTFQFQNLHLFKNIIPSLTSFFQKLIIFIDIVSFYANSAYSILSNVHMT